MLEHVGALARAQHAELAGVALQGARVAQGVAAGAQALVLALELGDLGRAVRDLLAGRPVGAGRPYVEADDADQDGQQRDAGDAIPADAARPAGENRRPSLVSAPSTGPEMRSLKGSISS